MHTSDLQLFLSSFTIPIKRRIISVLLRIGFSSYCSGCLSSNRPVPALTTLPVIRQAEGDCSSSWAPWTGEEESGSVTIATQNTTAGAPHQSGWYWQQAMSWNLPNGTTCASRNQCEFSLVSATRSAVSSSQSNTREGHHSIQIPFEWNGDWISLSINRTTNFSCPSLSNGLHVSSLAADDPKWPLHVVLYQLHFTCKLKAKSDIN